MKIIIMAGGGGTRLWPLSRKNSPKQYQALFGARTLIQQAFDRISKEFAIEDIYISLQEQNIPFIKTQLPQIPVSHYIIEPEKRDTGPAMGFMAAVLVGKFPDEPIAFCPTDHIIQNNGIFLRSLRVAEEIIREQGKLVDIGVVPAFPNTNLGYTRIGKKKTNHEGITLYDFLGHTEKPDLKTAKKYLESGEYLWHASYFMWTPRKFLEAFSELAPQMFRHLKAIAKAIGTANEQAIIKREFSQIERVSFDYAVMEKIAKDQVLIIKADFFWSDIGMWQAVKKLQEENKEDNVVKGDHLSIDCEDCLIYGRKKKMIATLGLKDVVIIDTDDALLVADKSRDFEIKKIIEKLKEEGREDLL